MIKRRNRAQKSSACELVEPQNCGVCVCAAYTPVRYMYLRVYIDIIRVKRSNLATGQNPSLRFSVMSLRFSLVYLHMVYDRRLQNHKTSIRSSRCIQGSAERIHGESKHPNVHTHQHQHQHPAVKGCCAR